MLPDTVGTHRLASLPGIEIHLAVGEQEQVVVAWIAGVERGGGTVRRRSRKKVSLPSTRGRGEAISIHSARSLQRNACGVPTGVLRRRGLELHAAPLQVEERLPSST